MNSSLTVCLLAYHEAENLKWLLPEIKKQIDLLTIPDVEYLIIDSMGPTDDTEAVCKAFGARYIRQEAPNYAGAMKTAYKYATKDDFFICDADGSQVISCIPAMYAEFTAGYDVVQGSKYVPGGATSDAISSQYMSRFLNWVYTRAIGIKAKDISGSIRFMHTEELKKIIDLLLCQYYDTTEEIIFKQKLLCEKVYGRPFKWSEVPIKFIKREIGESKRSTFKFICNFAKTLVYFLILRFMTRKTYNPGMDDKKAKDAASVFFYLVFGVLTTVINVGTFALFNTALGMHYIPADIIAWIVAVLVAYITNKTMVFDSWSFKKEIAWPEFVKFIGSRIATGILDVALMFMLVDLLTVGETWAKVLVSIIVIILNYILSKTKVFKK